MRVSLPAWLRQPLVWGIALVAVYLVSHFSGLLSLPVFADESIYIRWAQLLRHDNIYLYFSLNDGKPPLFIWLVATVLSLPLNPLFAARALSVIIGLGQLFVSDRIVTTLKGGSLARLSSAVIITTAPFWFFHHRIALMDALLTLFLSIAVWGLFRLDQQTSPFKLKTRISSIVLAGGGFGLALWTKTPALFIMPFFVILAWLPPLLSILDTKKKRFTTRAFIERTMLFALAGALGLSIFLLLRLQPTFGSLFSRSGDFTFTVQEILSGNWRTSLDNIGRALEWVGAYLRPELVALSAFGLLLSGQRKNHWLLWLGGLAYIAPLILLGKTLHPRYFLPIALFLTASGALMVEEAYRFLPKTRKNDLPWGQIVFALVVGFYFLGSLRFLFFAIFTPNQTPFVLADRSQYLTEWSSGHGIREVRDALIERAQRGERTTVVTEGSFGTLPDGLLLEFDTRPEIQYLRIQGLEQYPVKYLPNWVFEEAASHTTWLVVNEHRMQVPLDQVELIARYPRPYGAPELHVYTVRPRAVE